MSSYDRLGPAKGSNTKSRTYIDGAKLGGVETVTIVPARFSGEAAAKIKSEKDRNLVTNAINRSLCVGLSEGYRVVGPGEPADLKVRATVTDIVATDKALAGISTVTSLGTGAVLPIGLPRLPFGLGGIAVEAEAVDAAGVQRAAVVWSRGANSITNSARVSEVGDAYSLGSAFGKSFARVIVAKREAKKGEVSPLSGQQLQSALGGKPKYDACDAFGRAPGVAGLIANKVGAPPEWTDKGAR